MNLADAASRSIRQSPLDVAADDRVVHHDRRLPVTVSRRGSSSSRIPGCRIIPDDWNERPADIGILYPAEPVADADSSAKPTAAGVPDSGTG